MPCSRAIATSSGNVGSGSTRRTGPAYGRGGYADRYRDDGIMPALASRRMARSVARSNTTPSLSRPSTWVTTQAPHAAVCCIAQSEQEITMTPTLRNRCDSFATVGAMERSVRVVRVFGRDGAGGNPLGIHEGLLDDDEMQAVAAALGYSETIFLDTTTTAAATATAEGPANGAATLVRIFTPTFEMPFAGHPLVGATWHAAVPGSTIALRCRTGTVTGRRSGADRAGIDVEQLPAVEDDGERPDGVTAAWIVRMPLAYEMHRVAGAAAVASYQLVDRPDHRYVFALGDGGDGAVVQARFFAAGVGVDEDPATGSAAVALAAVLRHEGRTSGSLTIHQGAEMGCPSLIDLTWTPTITTIGGAVIDDGSTTVSV